MVKLGIDQILHAGLDDWRLLTGGLHGRFVTGDLAAGARFVAAVAEAARPVESGAVESGTDRPPLTARLTDTFVDLSVGGPNGEGVTRRDVDLARGISALAREQGLGAEPTSVVEIEMALDTADAAALGPFWAALLTGGPDAFTGTAGPYSTGNVLDLDGRAPLLWFQGTEPHETPRQRFHIDVWVPHDIASDRVAAAVAAGGRVVDDTHAPAFVVLADPDGNKACVCTCLDLSSDVQTSDSDRALDRMWPCDGQRAR